MKPMNCFKIFRSGGAVSNDNHVGTGNKFIITSVGGD